MILNMALIMAQLEIIDAVKNCKGHPEQDESDEIDEMVMSGVVHAVCRSGFINQNLRRKADQQFSSVAMFLCRVFYKKMFRISRAGIQKL